jgi:hypothetical protein
MLEREVSSPEKQFKLKYFFSSIYFNQYKVLPNWRHYDQYASFLVNVACTDDKGHFLVQWCSNLVVAST